MDFDARHDTAIAQNRRRELDDAVEAVYSAFSRYTVNHPVVGCPCCTSDADDQRLRGKPLHLLNGDDLERFADNAVTTLGRVEDLKHFLPRLLEIAANAGSVGNTDLEIVLGKLSYTKWVDWPRSEQVAVEQYLTAIWEHTLSVFPSSPGADTWLCAIGQAAEDVARFLDAWRQCTTLAAARHLAQFFFRNALDITKHSQLRNAFWPSRKICMRQIICWVLSPETLAYMEDSFFRYADDVAAEELSQGVQSLELIRALVSSRFHSVDGRQESVPLDG